MNSILSINSFLTDASTNPSKTKMISTWNFALLVLLLGWCTSAFSQVNLTENFNASLGSFGGDYSHSTANPCAVGSARKNMGFGAIFGSLTSANQVGASNETDLTVEFEYKIINVFGGSATGLGWGSAVLEYSIDGGVSWVPYFTINGTNHVTSTSCATVTQVIPASSLPDGSDVAFQISNFWAGGNYYFYVDNFSATQAGGMSDPCLPNLILIGSNSGDDSDANNMADNESSGNITSTQTITTGATIDYDSAISIDLNNDFEVELGATFEAFIDGCNNGGGGSNVQDTPMDLRLNLKEGEGEISN